MWLNRDAGVLLPLISIVFKTNQNWPCNGTFESRSFRQVSMRSKERRLEVRDLGKWDSVVSLVRMTSRAIKEEEKESNLKVVAGTARVTCNSDSLLTRSTINQLSCKMKGTAEKIVLKAYKWHNLLLNYLGHDWFQTGTERRYRENTFFSWKRWHPFPSCIYGFFVCVFSLGCR